MKQHITIKLIQKIHYRKFDRKDENTSKIFRDFNFYVGFILLNFIRIYTDKIDNFDNYKWRCKYEFRTNQHNISCILVYGDRSQKKPLEEVLEENEKT